MPRLLPFPNVVYMQQPRTWRLSMLLVQPDPSDQVQLPDHLQQLDQVIAPDIDIQGAAQGMGPAAGGSAGPDIPIMLRASIPARNGQWPVVELPDLDHFLHEVRVHEPRGTFAAMAFQLFDGKVIPSARR